MTGELGQQHWSFTVCIISGRVLPGSRGGRMSAEDKKASANEQ